MSLLTLGRSLASLLPEFNKLDLTTFKFSQKFLNYLKTLSENSHISSTKKLKKIIYLCNYQFKKNNPSMLSLAEKLLENHFKLSKLENKPIRESIYKLYVITLINQCSYFEEKDLKKAMMVIIKALKVTSQFKFSSVEGKSLKFIAKLKESELCISSQKFDLGILCAQQVLTEVQNKLEKKNHENVRVLAKLAISAFHNIAVCEEARGMRSSADVALDNAELIREDYFKDDVQMELLEFDTLKKVKKFFRPGSARGSFIRKASEKRMTRLKIPRETIVEHIERIGYLSDPSRYSFSNNLEFPRRYYSTHRLKVLDDIISGQKDIVSMDTDKYFYNHIVKALDLKKDIKFDPYKIVDQVKDHVSALTEAKEDLKSKRKIFKPVRRDSEGVSKKVKKMETEFENYLKIQDVRLKSKLKTRVYQKLVQNIKIPSLNHRIPPPQTLHFKQPAYSRRSTVVVTPEPKIKSESPRPVLRKDDVKKEIEDQIDEIYQEITGRNTPAANFVPFDSPGRLASSTVRHQKARTSTATKTRIKIPAAVTSRIFKTEVTFK